MQCADWYRKSGCFLKNYVHVIPVPPVHVVHCFDGVFYQIAQKSGPLTSAHSSTGTTNVNRCVSGVYIIHMFISGAREVVAYEKIILEFFTALYGVCVHPGTS